MGFDEALELTAMSLRAYAATHRHWCIAYSGGKDSSATVTAVVHLILTGRVPAPESLTILFDTAGPRTLNIRFALSHKLLTPE